MDGRNLKCFAYAYDTTLVATFVPHLHCLIDKCNSYTGNMYLILYQFHQVSMREILNLQKRQYGIYK